MLIVLFAGLFLAISIAINFLILKLHDYKQHKKLKILNQKHSDNAIILNSINIQSPPQNIEAVLDSI